MHKYQASSSTVLPIATNDLSGTDTAESTSSTTQHEAAPFASLADSATNQLDVPSASPTQLADSADGCGEPDLAAQYSIMEAAMDGQTGLPSINEGEAEQTSGVRLRRASMEHVGVVKKPPPPKRKRSMSLQTTKQMELTKNYEQLVREFNSLKPYTRFPDGTYPRDTKCVICRRSRPSVVFFPCQHRCVCNDCVHGHRISADRSDQANWCACPVCMGDICLILEHSGKEEEKYWKWVMEVQPHLSPRFKNHFKEAARKLERVAKPTANTTTNAAPGSSRNLPTREESNGARRHTWQHPSSPSGHNRNHAKACTIL